MRLQDREIHLSEVSIKKKGQSFAFVMDTRYCDNAVALSTGADTLVAESTFLNEHEEEANTHGHLTAAQAARIASEAKVGLLVLTHFSQRYGEEGNFVAEAKGIFSNVIAVSDGDSVNIQRKRDAF